MYNVLYKCTHVSSGPGLPLPYGVRSHSFSPLVHTKHGVLIKMKTNRLCRVSLVAVQLLCKTSTDFTNDLDILYHLPNPLGFYIGVTEYAQQQKKKTKTKVSNHLIG